MDEKVFFEHGGVQVNGTRLRGEITSAAIVGVEWPKK